MTVMSGAGTISQYRFDHVIFATGHDWQETTEVKPGYFISPWPAPVLKTIPPCKVGILGTSLSGIDALITVATKHGAFLLDAAVGLQYQPLAGTDAFHFTMMPRKDVLPEADLYCEIPYRPLAICTPEAVDTLIAGVERGAVVRLEDKTITFDAFIDATGQHALSARTCRFRRCMDRAFCARPRPRLSH